MKFRGYEHGIIPHKELLKNLTTEEVTKEKAPIIEEKNVRRSTRIKEKEKVDYKKMNEGEKPPPINETSEVAQHMRSSTHKQEDMEIIILGYEQNWWKRGVKEAIDIRKIKPTLNKDQGRYHLGHIWTKLIEEEEIGAEKRRSSVIGRNFRENGEDGSNFITEEDRPNGDRN